MCLCGSTRFSKAFRDANLVETLAGRIVLSIGCDLRSDDGNNLGPEVKEELDRLHLHKIHLADRVHVLNVDGYVGQSTAKELALAVVLNREVTFLEKNAGEAYLEANARRLGHLGLEAYAWLKTQLPQPPRHGK